MSTLQPSRVFKDWDFDEHVGNAVRYLFRNKLYFPLNPYKSIIHMLRAKENIRSLPNALNLADLAFEQSIPLTFDSVPFVRFGSSNGIGLRYLSKLLSASSVQTVNFILVTLNDALGNMPTQPPKTKDGSAFFVETVKNNTNSTL